MREIKFRFLKNGEWIYFDMSNGNKWSRELLRDMGDNENTYEFETPPLQYTGLRDKNGKEIYEGDIVRTWRRIGRGLKENYIETVKYSEITARYYPWDIIVRAEIIGNIYENPELLKNKS